MAARSRAVQSPRTTDPQSRDWHLNREGTVSLLASGGEGTRMDGMVNPCERSINVVKGNKPKMLRGLSHKGTVAGYRDCPLPCHGHAMLPAHRAHLTRPCQPCGTWQARIAPSWR